MDLIDLYLFYTPTNIFVNSKNPIIECYHYATLDRGMILKNRIIHSTNFVAHYYDDDDDDMNEFNF